MNDERKHHGLIGATVDVVLMPAARALALAKHGGAAALAALKAKRADASLKKWEAKVGHRAAQCD